MKKTLKYFMCGLFALSLFTFVGCPKEPETVTFTDGKIVVENNTSQTIYVQTAAMNGNLSSGDEEYEKRVKTNDIVTIAKGKSYEFDYVYSDYTSEESPWVAVMVSYDKKYWRWYYYNNFILYYMTTTISVVKDAEKTFKFNTTYSAFPVDLDVAEYCKVPVTNSDSDPVWVQFVGWDDDSWNFPTPLSEKIKINPKETKKISYPEGFNDIKKSITAWSDKNGLGTWRSGRWTDEVPDSFNIYVDYNSEETRYEYFFH